MMLNHRIVTICGSKQFYHQMLYLAEKLTEYGYIVLVPFKPGDRYDETQYARISISDAIFVVNTHGFISFNARREIIYAYQQHKSIYYAYPALVNTGVLAEHEIKTEDVPTVVLNRDWRK